MNVQSESAPGRRDPGRIDRQPGRGLALTVVDLRPFI